jgi:hypothetical protein
MCRTLVMVRDDDLVTSKHTLSLHPGLRDPE